MRGYVQAFLDALGFRAEPGKSEDEQMADAARMAAEMRRQLAEADALIAWGEGLDVDIYHDDVDRINDEALARHAARNAKEST
jgi:hypothetical protein